MLCIASVIPLCQEGSHFRILALCKGWVCDLFLVLLCDLTAVWTAVFADAVIGCSMHRIAQKAGIPSKCDINSRMHQARRGHD